MMEYYERKQEYDNKNVSELDKAIKFLREQYERAQRIEFIYNPLAWALYQTWRHVDEPPKEPKKRIKDHVCNNVTANWSEGYVGDPDNLIFHVGMDDGIGGRTWSRT